MDEQFRLGVIIAAAGASRRFGGRSKLDEDLGGRPVLHRTVEMWVNRHEAAQIVVAGPVEPEGAWEEFMLRHGDRLSLLGAQVCKGGRTHRYESVRNALERMGDDVTHVAVHDGARPCASGELLDRVLLAAQKFPAVIPAVELSDTIKRVSADEVKDEALDPLADILGVGGGDSSVGKNRYRAVEETLSRERVVTVQTPQVFEVGLLRRAYAQKDLESTDDAQLVERLGERVVVVEGEVTNVKITRPSDMKIAMAVLGLKPAAEREVHKRF
jgi:2-C-methyl-D-erythritol 4-phosphate cytidylyltransferase